MTCSQPSCPAPIAYRYTWPGRDEAAICAGHAAGLRDIAGVLGAFVRLVKVGSE